MDTGKSVKEHLKENTWLSDGIVFKAGKFQLRKLFFGVHQENTKEKNRVFVIKNRK